MNLHGIVRTAINMVNPDLLAVLLRSSGYITGVDGRQVPSFQSYRGKIQVQGTSREDLKHINDLNMQGVFRKVYILGNWAGVIRADQRGGDVLKFAQVPGTAIQEWRIVQVLETWPDWCSVLVCLGADNG